MDTAVIIAAHKFAARSLLEAAEMVYGKQENLECIDFLETDDMETLMGKYREAVGRLDTGRGLLYLVDLFGGSPFNAACRIAAAESGQKVIAGVNVPMLIEVLAGRAFLSMEELIEAGTRAGRDGVRRYERTAEEDPDDE